MAASVVDAVRSCRAGAGAVAVATAGEARSAAIHAPSAATRRTLCVVGHRRRRMEESVPLRAAAARHVRSSPALKASGDASTHATSGPLSFLKVGGRSHHLFTPQCRAGHRAESAARVRAGSARPLRSRNQPSRREKAARPCGEWRCVRSNVPRGPVLARFQESSSSSCRGSATMRCSGQARLGGGGNFPGDLRE